MYITVIMASDILPNGSSTTKSAQSCQSRLKRRSKGKTRQNVSQPSQLLCNTQDSLNSSYLEASRNEPEWSIKRSRKDSCDELKLALTEKVLSRSSLECNGNADREDFDNNHNGDVEAGKEEQKDVKYYFRDNNFGELTDFERFVAENSGVDFNEKCFPSQVGEECELCLCEQERSMSSTRGKINGERASCHHDDSNQSNNKVTRKKRSLPANGADSLPDEGSSTSSSSKRRKPVKDLNGNRVSCDDSKVGFECAEGHSNNVAEMTIRNGEGDSSRDSSVGSFNNDSQSSWLEDYNETAEQSVRRKRQRLSPSDRENVSISDRTTNGNEEGKPNVGSSSATLNGTGQSETLSCWTNGIGEGIFDKEDHAAAQTITHVDIPNWMYVALDCEMVGTGPKGRSSKLARCSIVDFEGHVLYDKYIVPDEPITDYRTPWSGILPRHMASAEPTAKALDDIHHILDNKIIIGHSVYNDFRVLGMHPEFYTVRDTAQCRRLVAMAGLEGQGNGLRKLAAALLGRQIQGKHTGHCSVEDARTSLDLFKLVRREYEADLYAKWVSKKNKTMLKLSDFVETVIQQPRQWKRRVRTESAGDSHFLKDEYWPDDVLL